MNEKEKLMYEVGHHNIESIKAAIKEGYDVNFSNGDGSTYLHVAVINFDLEITKLLVEAGAEIDCVDKNENTPLIYAVSTKDPRMYEIAKYLISKGADLDFKAGEYTPRYLINMFERKELMEYIKEK